MIPAIDIFAGPGGLAEGFSNANFDIRLSVEMDEHAHNTLRFRSFCRKLIKAKKRSELVEFYSNPESNNTFNQDKLTSKHPKLWKLAQEEAMQATLGITPPEEVSNRIETALGKESDQWILLGGPPCQAYSLVGRAKMKGTGEKFENDHRHLLYREYLRIVAVHAPSIFVMENVKGLLSSKHQGTPIIDRIKSDLKNPRNAIDVTPLRRIQDKLEYDLYPLWKPENEAKNKTEKNKEHIINAEKQEVPQARHRLFIIGIRRDLKLKMQYLDQIENQVSAWDVLHDLPKIHSHLSKEKGRGWLNVVNEMIGSKADTWMQTNQPEVRAKIHETIESIPSHLKSGSIAVPKATDSALPTLHKWYQSKKMTMVLNHEARGHMPTDLHRYLYSSAFASVHGYSPKLEQYPTSLLPAHKNVNKKTGKAIFSDRFRTQCKEKPSTTITSHIHKDGHYFIHPDPAQCRSLTVREAARLQTFPDDYLFCGPRTEQFKQVGNAVPPYLAYQIALVIQNILT
ncbi:MAG: DNA cytosine methyltransferase [Opitutaceae bacterium]